MAARAIVAALLVGAAALGCRGAAEDPEPTSPVPPAVSLADGKVLPKLVGSWQVKGDPKSTYHLNADGSYKTHTEMMAMVGAPGSQKMQKQTTEVAGRWTGDAKSVFFETDQGVKLKIAYVLGTDGGSLDLRPPYAKSGTSLVRMK